MSIKLLKKLTVATASAALSLAAASLAQSAQAATLNSSYTGLTPKPSIQSSFSNQYGNRSTKSNSKRDSKFSKRASKSAAAASYKKDADTEQYAYNNPWESETNTNIYNNDFGKSVAEVGTWLAEKVSGIAAPASSCGASPSLASTNYEDWSLN